MAADSPSPKPRSDLGVRTLSGVVMMAIAIALIWVGGYAFMALIAIVGLGVMWEWTRLVFGFTKSSAHRALWVACGIVYLGVACLALIMLSASHFGFSPAVLLIAGVIGTDVGAYCAGRTIGGPKIAPKISPSKTWAGLFGGMVGAGLAMILVQKFIGMDYTFVYSIPWTIGAGALLAMVAQAGDFFESWMKRRAGVKDSGRLIPGHGGLFDRVDGLIAVAFVAGLLIFFSGNFALAVSPG